MSYAKLKNDAKEVTNLDCLERVTHHGDQHVGENDDDGNVVESEQEQADSFNHRRRVTSAREATGEWTVPFFGRVLDFDTFDDDQAEHRPEQRKQRPW